MFTILGITQNLINHPGKCPFCGSVYLDKGGRIACLTCDRSNDVLYEFEVWQQQQAKHTNTHQYRAGGTGKVLRLSKYRGA